MAGDLREILNGVRAERGRLTPEIVVEVAREESHPLHHRFEWDDGIAAHKYRLVQASNLLRVKFKQDRGAEEDPVELRAFWPVKAGESGDPDVNADTEYVPVEEVLMDPIARQVLLNQMIREAAAFRRRYQHMAEFATVVQEHLVPENATG